MNLILFCVNCLITVTCHGQLTADFGAQEMYLTAKPSFQLCCKEKHIRIRASCQVKMNTICKHKERKIDPCACICACDLIGMLVKTRLY